MDDFVNVATISNYLSFCLISEWAKYRNGPYYSILFLDSKDSCLPYALYWLFLYLFMLSSLMHLPCPQFPKTIERKEPYHCQPFQSYHQPTMADSQSLGPITQLIIASSLLATSGNDDQ